MSDRDPFRVTGDPDIDALREMIVSLRHRLSEAHDAFILAVWHAGGEVRIPMRDLADPPELLIERREDARDDVVVYRVTDTEERT